MREYLLGSAAFLLALVTVVSGQETPCGAGLQCVSQSSCPTFISARNRLESLRRGSQERARLLQKLRSLVCNKERREVCCEVPAASPTSSSDPDSPSYLPSLEEQQCGLEGGSAAFVLGGEDTSIGEFPFLGLLGKENGGNIKWVCGGSIINRWFVLSAAHCGDNVDYVRLGEWKVVDPECEDLDYCERERGGEEECGATSGECQRASQRRDCETVRGVRTCTEPYQDIAVAKTILHPGYGLTPQGLAVNDIMLLKLSSPAVFNDFVQPVCLPSPSLDQFGELEASKFGNNLPTVVGWGRTSNRRRGGPVSSAPTDVQQKLKMPTRDHGDCLARWQDVLKALNSNVVDLAGELSPSLHLCAGGEDGKDSCKGDSGGPLMARRTRLDPWQLVGVVSGGTKRCGIGAPGIFTRVTQYRQWIRNNLN